jgi:diguanylate cyclase (GGDEF)-like protein
VIRLFIENGVLRDKIIYESEHDKLTGLYNKDKYLISRDKDFGRPGKIAVFNFDVNNLKIVNDSQGHEAGDMLIVKAAESLHHIINENIRGYRIGGDEFIAVVPQIEQEHFAALSEKLRRKSKRIPMAIGAIWQDNSDNIEDLVNSADQLMYNDKAQYYQDSKDRRH